MQEPFTADVFEIMEGSFNNITFKSNVTSNTDSSSYRYCFVSQRS